MPYASPPSKTEEYQGLQSRTQAKVKIKKKKAKPIEMWNSGDLCPLRKTFADGEVVKVMGKTQTQLTEFRKESGGCQSEEQSDRIVGVSVAGR